MRFIHQENLRNCGQIAVAMLVDRPLEDIAEVIPHSHGTRTKELVRALRHFGYSCPDRMKRRPIDFGLAQLHVSESGWVIRGSWHWVAIGSGMVWDGQEYGPILFADYQKQATNSGHRLTSFLPVIKS
jgi:hypothetical protein